MALDGIVGVSDSMRGMVVLVRSFMRDHPQLNKLVHGEESSDRQILWALLDAISEFNGTPPRSSLNVDQILNEGQQYLLMRMAVVALMESIMLLQTRNHVNYSVGGLNLGVNDKSPLLMSQIQLFKGTIEQKLLRVKIAMNIEAALEFPGISSELFSVNVSYAGYS